MSAKHKLNSWHLLGIIGVSPIAVALTRFLIELVMAFSRCWH
jgi:hypothetical protein